jgi:hypothetical protein
MPTAAVRNQTPCKIRQLELKIEAKYNATKVRKNRRLKKNLGRQELSQESDLTESLPSRKLKPEMFRKQVCLTSP